MYTFTLMNAYNTVVRRFSNTVAFDLGLNRGILDLISEPAESSGNMLTTAE